MMYCKYIVIVSFNCNLLYAYVAIEMSPLGMLFVCLVWLADFLSLFFLLQSQKHLSPMTYIGILI